MANRLVGEQSPYLLQHAHNPVDWYPWGDEAFMRAKTENKPVLVSIGYAACHWCHVMERESFENEEVAAYMNARFICVKVDREEHPDVDHFYMDAVQALTGSGGWPLNVFVTPDRVPFYGGTYFPPRPAYSRISWTQLLESIHEIWTNKQDEVAGQTEQMLHYLRQASAVLSSSEQETWNLDTCRQMAGTLLEQADKTNGGFGRAPKFPGTMSISFLLEHYHFTGNQASLDQALKSLDAMISGGIYDQAGGGFARYATDDKWLIPHFEKMLYDNALILLSLCDAWKLTHRPLYKEVIEETIAFVERELKGAEGGYYSALDADSEGVEGKFYTWVWDEWQAVFGPEDTVLMAWFGVSPDGNWEGTNILHRAKPVDEIASETGLSCAEIEARITAAKEKILVARTKRVRPLTDDKALLSWNALMNLALTAAADALDRDDYLERASAHMEWMLQSFSTSDGLMHVWKNGKARIAANLDDNAYLIKALLQLASAGGNMQWIREAAELANNTTSMFLHESGTFFYYTSASQTDIPVRKVDMYDGATPSANAVMTGNLLLLGECMEQTSYMEQAFSMLQKMASMALRYPGSFSYWGQQLQRYAAGLKTVVCAGENAMLLQKQLRESYLPNVFTVSLEKQISDIPLFSNKFLHADSRIFVCTGMACMPPVSNTEAALQLIK